MSAADPEVPFAFWLDPTTAVKISYSLPLFNEIDFQANEGYRRIPHGGVEVGGLLYGKIEANSVSIEAFRSIDCEHASGPSFLLSERDLVNLSESILAAPKDEELQGLEPVGWFIAHTRGPLRMTDREAELFRRFFPEPRRVTVLVKPERFRPTRFAFLVRSNSGSVNPEGEASAVILPLPGRPGKSGPGLAPAIPAPQSIDSKPLPQPIAPVTRVETIRDPAEQSAPLKEAAQAATPIPAAVPLSKVAVTGAIPSQEAYKPAHKPRQPDRNRRPGRLLLVLLVAALLGCGAGYWAYVQLPPPVISLRVQKESKNLLVVWDPAQTQSSRYALIRINNGLPAVLTPEQKASGIAQVPLSGDSVKVEIVAQHWARESRGIIRFVPERRLPSQAPTEAMPVPQQQ